APNGGPTETIALMKSSPAINAIFDSSAPPFDQRGVPRPLGVRPCIGAFEFGTAFFTLSGRIAIGAGSSPVPGVTVQANSLSVVTDVNGDYAFSNLIAATYVVTPQLNSTNLTGLFNPTSSTTNVTANVTGVNFTASANTLATITPGATNNTPMQLSFSGIPKVTYLIQTSTNLASQTNWVTLSTNNFTNGVFNLNITNSKTGSQHFYRAIAP
ncbi:MAG TPA: choice-of-anchor Q domain-containing protein, partial [Verrucomicrobiae bacterium]|nr:choice-of-anchor Q domain-containing protein [Verrucomicrobiae bacterium]